MDMNEAQYKYLNDPAFRRLVDLLMRAIDSLQFTPSEIKEAAIFAAIRFEQIQEHNDG